MTRRTRIAAIHAVTVAMQPTGDAFAQHWPDAEVVNLLDDSLALDRGTSQELPPAMVNRFADLMAYAGSIGVQGVLFTCSAFGPAIAAVAAGWHGPVLKPNEAMFEAAFEHGRRIGMLSTFEAANAPMEEEFRELSRRRGQAATITIVTVPEAMTALRAGDVATHNALLAQAAKGLADCDAIMLAQFSASRAEAEVQSSVSAPVLTSPATAVEKLRRLLTGDRSWTC